MRRMTVTERIIARAAGVTAVTPGEEVWAKVDLAVMNDSSGPRRIQSILERLGDTLWDPERIVLVSDHFIPPSNPRHAEILSMTRRWAQEKGIAHFYEYQGILHNLLLEFRLVRPGMLVVGADSHTTTAGAVGAVAVPIGSSELAAVLVTGEIWLRVPETVCIKLHGKLQPGVMARDIDFHILGTLKSDFAIYKSIEFSGPAIAHLSIEERSVLTNAGIEMGAKNALVPADTITWEYYDITPESVLQHDPCADFEHLYEFTVSTLEPQIALPHQVDNVANVSDIVGQPVDIAYLGSCVGAKLSDLRMAAQILRGHKVSIPFIVTPATRSAYEAVLRDGTLATLVEAGAIVQPPGCGPCAGVHMGILGPDQRAIASVTRNFRGRMGSRDAEIYLGSPATVAASVIEGKIADPRHYVTEVA